MEVEVEVEVVEVGAAEAKAALAALVREACSRSAALRDISDDRTIGCPSEIIIITSYQTQINKVEQYSNSCCSSLHGMQSDALGSIRQWSFAGAASVCDCVIACECR